VGTTPDRTASWIDAWRTMRAKPEKPMPSLDEAVRRLRKFDHLLDEPLARDLAEHGTRAVDGGYVWKHDPLHMTMGPYPYRLETATKYWQRVTCPVLIVDGAESRLNLSSAERAERRHHFASHRHVEVANAGHAVQRHQPDALAELLLALSPSHR
jgi:pimeloyl-ACP methyl ester carboxylesterase